MTDEEKALIIEMNKAILSITQILGILARNSTQLNGGVGENLVPKFNDFLAKNQHLVDPQIVVADASTLKRQ